MDIAGRGDCRGDPSIDGNRTERTGERTLGIERDAVEGDEVRGPDEDRDVIVVPRNGLVSTGSDRAENMMPACGATTAWIAPRGVTGRRDITIDLARQRSGARRIPRTGDRRGTNGVML